MPKIKLLNLVKLIINTPIEYGWRSGEKDGKKNAECPKTFGIKSHIEDFYCAPDENILQSGEFIQGDEFRFLVEPKWKNNLWIRVGLWVGFNILLMGFILSLIGYLLPQQDIIVGRFGEYIVMDKWAAAYNGRLIVCRLIGCLCVICGVIVSSCALLLLHCEQAQRREYYVMRTRMKPRVVVEPPMVFKESEDYWGLHCIPSTGSVKGVQPGFKRHFAPFRTTDKK